MIFQSLFFNHVLLSSQLRSRLSSQNQAGAFSFTAPHSTLVCGIKACAPTRAEITQFGDVKPKKQLFSSVSLPFHASS